jgi:cytochrome c551/c552
LVKKYPCVNCHSFDTPNVLLGPSLYDIGKRKDEAYIRTKLLDPDKVVVEGFPKGLMKATLAGSGFFNDIGKNPAILDNLAHYLVSLKGGDGGKEGAAAAPATVLMPNFNLSDAELQNVVTFLLGLQEHSVPWPKKSFVPATAAGQAAPGGDGSAWVGNYGMWGRARVRRISVNLSWYLTRW